MLMAGAEMVCAEAMDGSASNPRTKPTHVNILFMAASP